MQSEGAISLPSLKDNGNGCVFILKCIYRDGGKEASTQLFKTGCKCYTLCTLNDVGCKICFKQNHVIDIEQTQGLLPPKLMVFRAS